MIHQSIVGTYNFSHRVEKYNKYFPGFSYFGIYAMGLDANEEKREITCNCTIKTCDNWFIANTKIFILTTH